MSPKSSTASLPNADAIDGCDLRTRADAIIVLGGGIRRDGSLTVISRARVELASELYHEGVAPRVILTGRCGAFFRKPVSEASAMCTQARVCGVPADALLLEEDARDTLGNARYTREKYLALNRWHRVHIVTSDFHAARAGSLFRSVLGDAYEVSFSPVPSGFTFEERGLRLLERIKVLDPRGARYSSRSASVG